MKKILSIGCLLLVICSVGLAQMKEYRIEQFGATGTRTTTLSETLTGGNGWILPKSVYISVETNATMSIYTPALQTTTDAATAATTNLTIHTTSSNVVGGVTLAAADSVLVYNSTSGYQLAGLSTIGAWDSDEHTTVYTTDDSFTASSNDVVYIIDGTDDVASFPALASTAQDDLHSIFASRFDMPVHITIDGTLAGTCYIGGVFAIIR